MEIMSICFSVNAVVVAVVVVAVALVAAFFDGSWLPVELIRVYSSRSKCQLSLLMLVTYAKD